MKQERSRVWFALWVLFAINTLNFYDRQILGAVGETVRNEWSLSDTALGSLGTAFTLLYAVVGVPLGRMTDRFSRRWILCAGVTVWSLLTAASGLARNFSELFVVRLGVGSGEAACAPASTSLIGDLFPASQRAKALSVFMLGLPLGIALSFLGSSLLEHRFGWRFTFYIAAIPGLICAVLALLIWEPVRGSAEAHNITAAAKRKGSPYLLVLSIPTMWWIIASGALHNFNMYAIGAFLSPFLQRVHLLNKLSAGLIAMVVFGLAGIPGLIVGGLLADRMVRRKANGRLVVATVAILISAPLMFLGLGRPVGDMVGFVFFAGLGMAAMYVYYATVYSAIQDVIEPSLRGTAMALYFFAMYVLGASLGPVGMGFLSSHFTRKAALAAGVTETGFVALRPFAAEGLHSALYVVPVLGVLLGCVLFAASRTVTRDMEKLQHWMRESAAPDLPSKVEPVVEVVPLPVR
ncbi:MAG: MFS transporter [Pyrinomonadaceae bacterium]|nr:MFS transporter [Pyrinomonadaceae bacterium]